MAEDKLSLLTVDALAECMALPKSRIYNLIFKGQIPHIKIGATVRFRKSDIEQWLSGQAFRPVKT